MSARCLLTAALLVALAMARPAQAAEVVLFATQGYPRDQWSMGYGASLTSTWFRLIHLEGEAVRVPGESPDWNLTSFTGSAALGVPVAGLTPYAGVGVGLFRQRVADDSDLGVLRAAMVGVKARLKNLVVFRAEYRRLRFSGNPLIELEHRISAGVGIAF